MPIDEPHPQVAGVYRYPVHAACAERGLVLQAAGIEYDIVFSAGDFVVVVGAEDAALARAELDAYERETRAWRIPPPALPQPAGGWVGVVVYIVVLVVVELLVERRALSHDWLPAGRLDAGLVRQGEWYRSLTALSLHLDAAHLLANVLFGSLFGLFAGRLLGSGLAWMGIVTAGTAGNMVNAWIQPADHSAIGASTAVFAGLGIVSAYAWRRRWYAGGDVASRWAPLVGGVLLLAYTGTGGERTDFMGHLTGFGCGLLLGVLCGSAGEHLALRRGAQLTVGAVTIAALALAWWSALRAQG